MCLLESYFIIYFPNKECLDNNAYCDQLHKDYHYCTSPDAGINAWMTDACAKSCGYCFDSDTFETDINK